MIDINNEDYLQQIRRDAKDECGKRIIEFFEQGLPDFKGIKTDLSNEITGEEFKRIKGIRNHILKKIKILTSK